MVQKQTWDPVEIILHPVEQTDGTNPGFYRGWDNALPMAISLRTSAEIDGMRLAGRLASEVLDMLTPHIQAGVTTLEIDRLAHDYITQVQQAVPATLGYQPPGYPAYPASLCTSLNDVVCHGIPDDRPLRDGDILNVDVTVIKDGWHGDNSRMFVIGNASIAARRLCDITFDAMWKGIVKVRPVLRPRGWVSFPRGPTGAALRQAGNPGNFASRHDFHHRAHDQPGSSRHQGRPQGQSAL
jgi:Metallopeptidase family M24